MEEYVSPAMIQIAGEETSGQENGAAAIAVVVWKWAWVYPEEEVA